MLITPQNPPLGPATGPENHGSGGVPSAVAAVRARLAAAAGIAGRDPASVTLVAVSKLQSADAVAAACAAGVKDFGENYPQEGVDKVLALRERGLRPTWHFIGALQGNKTRPVAEHFDWVHTVDRLRTATRLSEQRPAGLPDLQVCLQVMVVPEDTKAGVSPAELPALARAVAALPRLKLRGLMCLPPPSDDPAVQFNQFKLLAGLHDALRQEGLPLDVLSMGMSADFEAAILAGSTHVRIGTAVFGTRPARPAPAP